MTIELRLPGVRQEAEPQAESDFDDLVRRTILSSHTVSPTRGALDSAVAEANPDDVLELHWEGDIVELVRVGDVESRYPQARRSDDGRLEIPTTRALSTARGSRFLNLKSIFHIRLDLKEALIEEATGAVVRYTVPKAIAALEERFQAKPGLFRVKADGDLEDEPVTGLRAQDGPILVMLHGTFSSHEGSFSDLFGAAGKAATQEWRDLHAAYPNRVLSLQHRTVSVSPASNLRDMVRRLPKGATVDLLSYSRGGIIGDLLSRHPWSEGDLDAFFEFPPYKEIRRDLTRLSSLLAQKELRVRRFVRVASPAAGTLLASERLDTYLNVILSLLAKLGGPGGEFVKLLATQIVSTRTKADLLPGLESMMPHKDRGFVPFLNQLPEDEGRDEALAVIAGDVRGGGLFDRIKDFFSHLYYREPNDFVVDSRSMFRGVPRTKSVGFYFRSPNATHFSYFGQAETRSRMAEWLIDQSEDRYVDLVHGQDYGGIRGAPRAVRKLKAVEDIRADARPGEALVYLLPGIMGTHLAIKEGADVDRYWINVARLLFGGMRKLHMDQQGVVPDGLLESYYGDLYDRLGRENTVIHFGFDWRKPIAESARLLRDSIQLDLDDQAHPNRPVRIIAHSMGGLVARTFVAENPRLWKRMTERGGRLIMMGTPNFGSYAPAQVFTQNHRLLKLVAGVTIGDLDELTELVRTFPGLVEMLPKRGDRDLLTPAAWEGFGSLRPGDAILDGARKFRERLDTTAIDPDHMVYVAGHSEETPASMERSGSEVRFRYTGRGDGTVPWDLGILPGVQTYYVDAGHDKIPGHTKSFDGFADLLSDGETSKLETQPPTVSRGGKEELFESRRSLDQEEIRYFPNEEDLVDAICDLPEEFDDEPEFPLDLRVVNGNVKEARHRVLVGHYTGDPIVHAEGVIDRRLGGRMSRDLQLDRYPGPLESARVYGAHDGFPGALVVGLGHPGHLRRTSLERSLTAAFLELAVSDLPAEDEPVRVIEVSSLLIGTYGGSRVSIEDSVSALVEAALEANARLENQHLADRVQIGRIEIVELYRDIATDAGHAIRRVAERKRGWVRAAPTIEVKEGARRSRPHSPYNTGWSRRLRIATTDTGLEFEATTDLARLLPLPRSIQWSHVDGMLEKAMSGDTEAPSTLFQYLMPIDLVEAAGDSPDTIVELDSQSARIPWELLDPPSEGGSLAPLGVRVGMLRTLVTTNPRSKPRRASRQRALVVGEPADVEPALPGAVEEAERVADLLRERDIDVGEPLIQKSADEIFSAFYREEYDIIHIAAHGVYEEDDAECAVEDHCEACVRSGVFLADRRLLTASEFENLRAVPSIVFLNCCHLGRTATGEIAPPKLRDPNRLAASLAEHLVQMGVAVVVVAGWAVEDQSARGFAECLYRQLLDGATLQDAVRTARELAYQDRADGDVTWGAYQVYGDPGYVLHWAERRGATGQPRRPVFVSHQELVDYLTDIEVRAKDADPAEEAALHEELRELQIDQRALLAADGETNFAMGRAFAALGLYADAIPFFEKAATTSNAPMDTVEQLANCEGRAAFDVFEQDPKQAVAWFDRSVERLEGLLQVSESGKRHAMVGSTLRRRAVALKKNGAARKEWRPYAVRARNAYSKAVACGPPNLFYPLNCKISLDLCLSPRSVDPSEAERARDNAAGNADPWAAVGEAEATLLAFLASGEGSPEEVAARLIGARNAGVGSTQREVDSGNQHLEALDELIASRGAIRDRLRDVMAELQNLV